MKCDVTSLKRRLRQESSRRRAAEAALKKSELHHDKSLAQARRLQEQMRHLSHQILTVQEEERKRISRELHDQIVQTLTGINVRLANLKAAATMNGNGLQRKINSTQRLVEKSVEIVHRFARDLRPTLLDDLGLIPALHSFLTDFTKRTGIRIHLTAFTSDRSDQLDSAKRTAFFRLAQEALTNVARHAHASYVKFTVQRLAGAIGMEVTDNGRGFQVDRVLIAKGNNRLGVLGMRERVQMVGGQFELESTPGMGTTIRAKIPIGKRPPETQTRRRMNHAFRAKAA
ncbi:MAG: sensor histidine kinase [Verrucomicrobiia bacterium]